jgi:DNA-binding MarR family transcriptional regulator
MMRPAPKLPQTDEAAGGSAGVAPPLTISRPGLLIDGSDRHFRRLVHGLFGFLVRHEAIRVGHAACIGLGGVEYTVLISIGHLAADGDVSVKDVAAHLHVSGAFVTTITGKLVRKGLVDKRPDPADRRRVCLTVTERGQRCLADLAPVQRQVNDVEFACLDRQRFLLLLDIVDKLIDCGDRAMALQAYLSKGVGPEGASNRAGSRRPKPRR